MDTPREASTCVSGRRLRISGIFAIPVLSIRSCNALERRGEGGKGEFLGVVSRGGDGRGHEVDGEGTGGQVYSVYSVFHLSLLTEGSRSLVCTK